MGTIRACLRWRFKAISSFRRILGHARQPYILFGLGVVLLCASLLLLHPMAGVSRIARIDAVKPHTAVTQRTDTSQPEFVDIQLNSSSAISSNGSGLQKSPVDEMEHQLREMQKKINVGKFHIKLPFNTSGHYFRYRDLAATQAQRQARIRHICQGKQLQQQRGKPLPGETPYHEGWYGRKFLYAVMEVYGPQNFFFCPVLKVGSTFFRRLFYALSYGKKITSPYQIPINTALSRRARNPDQLVRSSGRSSVPAQGHPGPPQVGRPLTFLEDLDLRAPPEQRQHRSPEEDKRLMDFLDRAGKVMFTRDPYAKLLSGYMDKLFAPNPYFWRSVGRSIIKKFRPNASERSLRCGHDVTFPEFIKHVIDNERSKSPSRDTHFVPSYDQCKPCDFRYDVIGKMETFPADVSLVLAQLGHNLSRSTLDAWNRESEMDAIDDSIHSAYTHWRSPITKCMSWREANKRIWRKLQTRGLVSRDDSLPVDGFPQYSLAAAKFAARARQFWEKFRSAGGERARQKRETLSSAYSLIPREELEQLREFFSLDLDLFHYDPRPDMVFKANRTWDVFTL